MPVELSLRADCTRCAGLCCVAPAFSRSADFALEKPAGQPCVHLAGFRCTIHAELRERGFPGCTVYDCFGAGQHVVQETFGGRDWRTSPETSAQMFRAFEVMRSLHELLWYLTEALSLGAARPLVPELSRLLAETEELTRLAADDLVDVDVAAHRARVNGLLLKVSALVRAGSGGPGLDRRGADLVGADLRADDLRGASLRGAVLVGADLRGLDLALADVTGADLRGADLALADLTGCLFLSQAQVDSARGDATTQLPSSRTRPAHWQA